MADIELAQRRFSITPTTGGGKTPDLIFPNERGNPAAAQKPSDIESIDSAQPAGLVEMEAITVVWTKNWLYAAYAS